MEVGYIASPVILGHEDEAETLLKRLVGRPKELDIVPIVGMPGLGKTTLATKLYSHETVMGHFDVRLWCCISQVYDRRKVLSEILKRLDKQNTAREESDPSEWADELRKLLKGKRYLIVVDDLWSIDSWDDLRTIFPDDNKGSRIVLTTRLNDVASYTSNNPHHLRHLTEEESWELLKKTVFEEESCPDELEEIGNEIASSCLGLPLAIVLTAGLLARGEKEVGYWKEVTLNLSSNLFHDAKWLMEVIELSYKYLLHHLRPCFLYFGTFLEDEEIPIWKLIQLWICEGFIPHNEFIELTSLEHVATSYLLELIGSNLVTVAKRSSLGRLKVVRVHDLIHQFCSKKAQEEIHLLQIYGSRSSGYNNPQVATDMTSWRIVCSDIHNFMMWNPPTEGTHSLRFTVSSSAIRSTEQFEDSLEAFKLLTVLDLENVKVIDSFPQGILLLIHLRYLSISGAFREVPSAINFLVNLETLILKSVDRWVKLPKTIWDMVNLRHLQLSGISRFWCSSLPENSQKPSQLGKLETLCTVRFHLPYDNPIISHILRNIVKLVCVIRDDDFESQSCQPVFQSLDRLQSLSLNYYSHNIALSRREFDFPSTLRKLTLLYFDFRDPWRRISTIGELPNLENLNLDSCHIEEDKWDVNVGEFRNLNILKLQSLGIVKWNASEDAFPNLKRLVLRHCGKLESIPSSFESLYSLQLIEVENCSQSSTNSAMEIKETQIEEMGNAQFNVIISDS
ncbi:putative late blight resistance protein homolog R1B-16 [Nicotiana tabacum]|uniref:Late blight resistance protein homolog R1B-16 n=1 Tax=Nicotiana tabacum TaxID=4097 RepID=A0A1S3Y3A7_TOBAC|nr:PREDICTED: putative late blight resistance protein homolog R1B-16 isoform X1 [Nicotiana tabacum]